jgi:hypothetical protein
VVAVSARALWWCSSKYDDDDNDDDNSCLSNKIEKKSDEIDLVARCGGEAANSSSSEIENKSPTRSTLSFAPGK